MHLRHRRRSGASLLAAVFGSVLLLSGCGFGVQTLQPYTPAQGVNAEIGSVKVRNLAIISDAAGKGYVSASLVSPTNDTLAEVSGHPVMLDGSAGRPLAVTGGMPVALSANKLAVLTEPTASLEVSSPDLSPGLQASVTLVFASGFRQTIQTPVLSSKDPVYASVSPAPTPTPTRTATPTREATPRPSKTP